MTGRPGCDHRTRGGLPQAGRRTTNGHHRKIDGYSVFDLRGGVHFGRYTVEAYVKNLFDVRGQISKGIQCNEFICGDPMGYTGAGGKVYTTVTRPRTMGLRVGRKF